ISLEGTNDVATRGDRLRLLRAAAREDPPQNHDVLTRTEALWRLAAALAESERTAELTEGAETLATLIRIAPAASARFKAAIEAGPDLGHFAVARAAAGSDPAPLEAARAALARVLFAVVHRQEAGAVMTLDGR